VTLSARCHAVETAGRARALPFAGTARSTCWTRFFVPRLCRTSVPTSSVDESSVIRQAAGRIGHRLAPVFVLTNNANCFARSPHARGLTVFNRAEERIGRWIPLPRRHRLTW
jgi:hypothetical protein